MSLEQMKAEKRKQETIGTIAYTKMLLKQISYQFEEIEKENAEFKQKNEKLKGELEWVKEIIKNLLTLVDPIYEQCEEYCKILEQAEQFLKEEAK